MVKTFLKWFVLINNSDVANVILLMEALDTMLN